MKTSYTAVIQQDGTWWIGWIEEKPGINSQGKTREELLGNLSDALEEALEMNREELSGRHFTCSAIHIIEQLVSRAADRSMLSNAITEQTVAMLLLWSLLRWERKVGLVALENTGAEPDVLARELDWLLWETSDEASLTGQTQFMTLPSGKRVEVLDIRTPLQPLLAQAEHEALGLAHTWVGSEHLLLAIIRQACPPLWKLLEKHSVNYERVKQAIQEILQG